MARRRTRATQFLILWCLMVSYLSGLFTYAAPITQTGDPNDPMTGELVYETTISVHDDDGFTWFETGTSLDANYLYRVRIDTDSLYMRVGYGSDESCDDMRELARNYLNDRGLSADSYQSVPPVDGGNGYFVSATVGFA